MTTTSTLVLVVVFAVTASGLVRKYAGRFGMLPDAQYIVIGAALGPLGVGALGEESMRSLGPVISLLLGIMGFVLGLALRRRLATTHAVEAGLSAALLCVGAFGAVFVAALSYVPGWVPGSSVWIAFSLACAALATSLPATEASLQVLRAKGTVTELIRGLALALSVVAVAAAGAALAWRRSAEASHRFGLSQYGLVFALVGLGLASGLLFVLFMGHRNRALDDRLFLATVGIITFSSGVALAANVSPLLINMLAGLVVSLVSKDAEILYAHLERLERPATILLMLFAGAIWTPVTPWLWLVLPIYLAARFCILRTVIRATCIVLPGLPNVPRLGNALLRQGGLTVAIAINHYQVAPQEGNVILCIAAVGVVLSDLWAPSALKRVVVDAGEHDQSADTTTTASSPIEQPQEAQ